MIEWEDKKGRTRWLRQNVKRDFPPCIHSLFPSLSLAALGFNPSIVGAHNRDLSSARACPFVRTLDDACCSAAN